jgi:hypothetical protein
MPAICCVVAPPVISCAVGGLTVSTSSPLSWVHAPDSSTNKHELEKTSTSRNPRFTTADSWARPQS